MMINNEFNRVLLEHFYLSLVFGMTIAMALTIIVTMTMLQ